MVRPVRILALSFVVWLGVGSVAAQDKPAEPPPAAAKAPVVPLQVDFVVSRFQGEKRISRLPYTVSVNANSGEFSHLRMVAQIPVPNVTLPTHTYQDVGTNIDCLATTGEGDRFQLRLTIADTSVYMNGRAVEGVPEAQPGVLPVLRSFKSSNTLLLRDGQSSQFTAATDRVSGETTRVEVTLRVVD